MEYFELKNDNTFDYYYRNEWFYRYSKGNWIFDKEKRENDKQDKYMGSVKVGAKGQIVIPKEAREMFNIEPGDIFLIWTINISLI